MASSLKVNLNNTFENYKVPPGSERVKMSFRDVLNCSPRFLLMCYGKVGTGKTHLCHASSIELYRMGLFTRVYQFPDILNTLRATINNPEFSYDEILNNYCYAERLIIDDVGAGGSDTEYGSKILESIVCARYSRELLTIMTTNKDIEGLPERVSSRLKDKSTSYLITNEADDYRLLK